MHKSTGVIRLIIVLIKMRMDEWTDATDQLAASPRPGRSSNNTPSSYTRIIHHQDHPQGSSNYTLSFYTRIILLDYPQSSSTRIIQQQSIILHQDHPRSVSIKIFQQDHPPSSSNSTSLSSDWKIQHSHSYHNMTYSYLVGF